MWKDGFVAAASGDDTDALGAVTRVLISAPERTATYQTQTDSFWKSVIDFQRGGSVVSRVHWFQ